MHFRVLSTKSIEWKKKKSVNSVNWRKGIEHPIQRVAGINNGTVGKNVETETYVREKTRSIFIVATPALLAVTRDPGSDGSYSRNFQLTHQFRYIYIYISVDPFVPRIPVSLRKISAVKMTNFIMPSIPQNSFDSFPFFIPFVLLLLSLEYISREFLAILFLANFGI